MEKYDIEATVRIAEGASLKDLMMFTDLRKLGECTLDVTALAKIKGGAKKRLALNEIPLKELLEKVICGAVIDSRLVEEDYLFIPMHHTYGNIYNFLCIFKIENALILIFKKRKYKRDFSISLSFYSNFNFFSNCIVVSVFNGFNSSSESTSFC